MANINTEELSIDGVRSLLRVAAPPSRTDDPEAVVFVHGNPGSSEDWSGLLAQVGDFARAVAPDMPGYGKSDRPKDFEYTVPGYGRHLAKMLDQLGIARVHLVLHDFGGPWGLQFASDNPHRVMSLSFFDCGVVPGFRWHYLARIWRTPILGELFQLMTNRWAVRLLLNKENPRPFPEEFLERTYDDVDWPMKRAILKLYRATDDLGAMTVGYGESLKSRNIPALVIWGDSDPYTPAEHAEAQLDYFDADVHVLPDCGHWAMIDEPERVSKLVLPFLKKQVRSLTRSPVAP